MSPKYRLRPTTNAIQHGTKTPKRGRTVFLPIVMLAVVGLTALLVSTTQPPTLVYEQEIGKNIGTTLNKLAGITPQKIDLRDLPESFARVIEPELLKIDLNPEPEVIEEEPAEKFVAVKPLAVAEPISEEEIAEPPAVEEVKEIEAVAEVTDPILESIVYSDPELEQMNHERTAAGLPAPAPLEVEKVIPVASTVCRVEDCPDFLKLKEHELHFNLPGGSHRVKIGDFLSGDQRKLREVGELLISELAKGNPLNASLQSNPEINPDRTEPALAIPKAKLVTEEERLNAVPIVHSVTSGRFTPWMTPGELNDHILSKDCGDAKNFWDAGNWITAVEGRIFDGVQQYRIIHEKTPQERRFQWVYRIAQTREEFNRKLEIQKKSGFRLVQSQMYVDADEIPRFQAVWHRR